MAPPNQTETKMETIKLGTARGVSLNKAIEAAAMSRTILEKGYIAHMTDERLEQLRAAIQKEQRFRHLHPTFNELFNEYEEDQMANYAKGMI